MAYYLIGKITDKFNKSRLLKIATGFYVMAWLGRLLANATLKIFLIDSYKNLSEKFLEVPWSTISYDLASQENPYLFIVVREIVYNLARVIVLPLIILIFYINFHPFLISFALAAGCSLLYPRVSK